MEPVAARHQPSSAPTRHRVVVTGLGVDLTQLRGDALLLLAAAALSVLAFLQAGRQSLREAEPAPAAPTPPAEPGVWAKAALDEARGALGREREADTMTLHAEAPSPEAGLAEAVAATLQAVTKLKGAVVLAAPGSLPNDGKVIADERPA